MMKRLVCWLLGHRMVSITDPIEIRYWLAVWKNNGRLVMVKCARCGEPIEED